MIRRLYLCLCLGLAAAPASAFTPPFPGPATLTREEAADPGSTAIPTAPWTEEGAPPPVAEGAVLRSAWQMTPPEGFTTLSILQPIRAAIVADGWEILLDCDTDRCGGYDFRYALDLFPEPEMHVDLGDFRFISAQRGAARLAVTVSRSGVEAFVQRTEVTPDAPTPLPQAGFGAQAVVLEGLDFASGESALQGAQPALEPLLDWLRRTPQARVMLVGHTDRSGDAAANLALSRSRAEAVRDWLITQGIAAERLRADGVGGLAPRDTDATEAGRARNRRVEVLPD
ncbi:OmpA family protein [Falsirhodobacter algicola]|uniref:OmpA family protein n=1 Tax=Falsirhodobacter algicola TaxID=2692330 RepID=A0A8J8SL03_9RHOB|nr:OmpA family protein [Falsirhodobacter algicola]QUS36505.1 OmpA family protein [Falsirhodobacter algicola]